MERQDFANNFMQHPRHHFQGGCYDMRELQDVPKSVTKPGPVFFSCFLLTACCMIKHLSICTFLKE